MIDLWELSVQLLLEDEIVMQLWLDIAHQLQKTNDHLNFMFGLAKEIKSCHFVYFSDKFWLSLSFKNKNEATITDEFIAKVKDISSVEFNRLANLLFVGSDVSLHALDFVLGVLANLRLDVFFRAQVLLFELLELLFALLKIQIWLLCFFF